MQDETEFFKLINHIKTQKNHWVVFPFKKNFAVEWRGSVAFLLDIQQSRCLECCLRVYSKEEQESWTFTLKNGICLFTHEGRKPLSTEEENTVTALLSQCLSEAGVSSYTVCPGSDHEKHDSLASIDISV